MSDTELRASLLALEIAPAEAILTPSACMLYALSIGLGASVNAESAQAYVYEKDLRVFPTMATVMGRPEDWMRWPGLDRLGRRALHGAQNLVMTRPFRAGARIRCLTRIVEVLDKGEGRGAVIVVERRLFSEDDLVATLRWTVFFRDGGGFGGPSRSEIAPPPVARPPCGPVTTLTLPVRPDAALIYRLNGDLNPIHADPAVARAAGLERPILHGLQLYGSAAAAILDAKRWSPDGLLRLDMRFSNVAYPGETLAVDLWDADGGIAFQVRSPDRGVQVAEAGFLQMREPNLDA